MRQTALQKQTATLKETIVNRGWVEDRWGNFKKEMNGHTYRFKFLKVAVRFERKYPGGWFNVSSDYIKNVEILDDCIRVRGKEVI